MRKDIKKKNTNYSLGKVKRESIKRTSINKQEIVRKDTINSMNTSIDINRNNDIRKLLNELKNEKQKNKKLMEDLKLYRARNDELSKKINILQKDLDNKKKEIKSLNDLKKNLTNQNKELKDQNIFLNNEINILNNQNKSLNNQSNHLTNKSANLSNYIPGEKIIGVQFKSTDQTIDAPFTCKNIDIFVRLEEQVYEKYPEFRKNNNYFTVNGMEIKRFKTIEENRITKK